jgi:type II secretory pathway pseudopilin PulG
MLLVVAIIAVLAGIAIVAINPGKQLATVRNTERTFNLNEIHKAMQQYYIDHYTYPAATPTTLTEICNTGSNSTSTGIDCTGLIDLSPLVPTYLTSIPVDPQGSTLSFINNFIPKVYATTNGTGYEIMKTSDNKVALSAPQAELSATIAIGNPTYYVVTYNGNGNTGGSVPTDSGTYDNGTTATVLGNTGSLEKSGYAFSNWNTLANGSGTDRVPASTFTIGSTSVTLYAKWTALRTSWDSLPDFSATTQGSNNWYYYTSNTTDFTESYTALTSNNVDTWGGGPWITNSTTHPGPTLHAARAWKAPYTGNITINVTMGKSWCPGYADGIQYAILQGTTVLFNQLYASVCFSTALDTINVSVIKDQYLYFRVGPRNSYYDDSVNERIKIDYVF